MATKDKLPSALDIWGKQTPTRTSDRLAPVELGAREVAAPRAKRASKPRKPGKQQTRNGVPFRKQKKDKR